MDNFVKTGADNKTHMFFWLVIPVLLIIGVIGIELTFSGANLRMMYTEGGIVEILQFLFIGLAVLWAAKRFFDVQGRFLKAWVFLLMVGSFYIAGEEVSWGQWFFYWDTPDFWMGINDQSETNLHNTSSWLDQKPRLLLFAGMIVGGLIIPAMRRWKPSRLPTRFAAIYPENHMVIPALGVLVPYLVQEIAEHFFDIRLFERVSEVQELYMYYFILLYIVDLRKLKKAQDSV